MGIENLRNLFKIFTMKKIVFFFSILFILFQSLHCKAQQGVKIDISGKTEIIDGEKFFIHTVRMKQTLYSIAKAYQCSKEEIIRFNPNAANGLQINQELKIPFKTIEKDLEKTEPIKQQNIDSDTSKFVCHIVKKGETLYRIHKKYDIAIEDLKILNPGLTEDIYEGQIILLYPKKTENKQGHPKHAYFPHTVIKGETLYSLARKYGVNQAELVKINPDIEEGLKAGEIIKIPMQKKLGEALKVDSTEMNLMITHFFDTEKEYDCDLPLTGDIYNVALLLPLYLDATDSIETDIPMLMKRPEEYPSMRFIQFYEGFMLAMDSINNTGLNVRLFVYDVDERTESAMNLLKSGALNDMNLIIGPLYTSSFNLVADYFNDQDVVMVNPFSNKDEIVIKRPNVFKLIPSLNHQLNKVADYITDSMADANIIIVHTGTEKEFYLSNLLMQSFYRDSIHEIMQIRELVVNSGKLEDIKLNLEEGKENVLVSLTYDELFVINYIRILKNLTNKYNITVFGMPNWRNSRGIETEFLMKLKYHSFIPSHIDYESCHVQTFIRKFRKAYKTEPILENYAFHGYDIGFYFLHALLKFGKEFDRCIDRLDMSLLTTSFDFERISEGGFENTFVNVLRYNNYKVEDVWKDYSEKTEEPKENSESEKKEKDGAEDAADKGN